ncbi:aldehyde dehydrogenase family protein [Streptomyces sp. NPDC090442]|uniref:aldehyde dehydrogenase family protein n=1 Tax=Streptomyces sp. NPDC090442 TaxID=3365962 RepID=UPI003808D198
MAGAGPDPTGRPPHRPRRQLADREDEFTDAVVREQGKLRAEARGEVARIRAVLEFTAGRARLLGGVTAPVEEERTFAYTFRRPLGVVGLVSPRNLPLAIPVWKVAPALPSGCTAVLKPSPLTPLTAALLTDAAQRAGVPDGVLNLVQGDATAGAALVAHPQVAGISFTGSLAVGTAIHTASARRHRHRRGGRHPARRPPGRGVRPRRAPGPDRRPDHPLTGRTAVAPDDPAAAGARLLLREPGPQTRALQERVLADRELGAVPRADTWGPEAVKQCVAAGVGLALISEHAVVHELRAGTLTALPVTPTPRPRPISLVHRRDRLLSPAERAFLDVLRGVRHWPGEPDDDPGAPAPAT